MSRQQYSRSNFASSTGSSGRGSRNRADHANRGSRRGRVGATDVRPAHDTLPSANINDGLDPTRVIQTIPQPTRPSAPEGFPIENVKFVASYSWIDAGKPTIAVPGSPAIWTGRAVPFTLGPDNGTLSVHQSTTRMAEYPMLPLFAAADEIHEAAATEAPVDWPTVDVITDRSGLRNLLRWLNPSPGGRVRNFRIDIQLVGTKTLVLGRWEGSARKLRTGCTSEFRFEDATTRAAPGCPSTGHHRAITYDMVDMKMVVRFVVDACLSSAGSSVPEETTTSVDDLADALGGMTTNHRNSATTTTASLSSSTSSPIIDVIRVGTQVPQEDLVEVASRSAYLFNHLNWNEIYPQLALSQTPALHIGVHERGVFTQLHEWQLDGQPRTETRTGGGTTAPDISAQRRETAVQIVRLAKLLEDVQVLAMARGPGPAGGFSLVCENGELRAYACMMDSSATSCLPPDVVARFNAHTQI